MICLLQTLPIRSVIDKASTEKNRETLFYDICLIIRFFQKLQSQQTSVYLFMFTVNVYVLYLYLFLLEYCTIKSFKNTFRFYIQNLTTYDLEVKTST
jgi:hypothetical protein